MRMTQFNAVQPYKSRFWWSFSKVRGKDRATACKIWAKPYLSHMTAHNLLTMCALNNPGMKDWLERLRILEDSFKT